MKSTLRLACLALLAALLLTASSPQTYAGNVHVMALDKIDRAMAVGTLSRELGTLYKVYSIRSPEKIPEMYRPEGEIFGRCATMIIREARMAAPGFSPQIQAGINEALARPSRDYNYDSPGGYFKIHYNTDGADGVPTTDDNSNGIPDYIENLAWYADSSWEHEVITLGWRPPPSDNGAGGDNRYDIYTEFMSYYGYTAWEVGGPEPWDDYTSYISVHKNFIGFPPNDDPDGNPAGAAKATVAHEFNHACQFAYDAFNQFFFYELSATYMEDEVFDVVNDNYNYVSSFFSAPYTSLMEESYHAYSTFIFGVFLTQEYGQFIMPEIWDYMRYDDATVAVNLGLMDYGSSFVEDFPRFTEWNYFTGPRDDGLHYEEGAHYTYLNVNYTENSYPVSRSQTSYTKPQGWAANYIRFNPGVDRILEVDFAGQYATVWGFPVIIHHSSGESEVTFTDVDPVTGDGTIYAPFFPDRDYMIGIPANMASITNGGNYQYTATLHRPGDCDDDGQVTPLDVTVLVNHVYRSYHGIARHDSFGDCNCDGSIDPLDVTILVIKVYLQGPDPCT
ncbi:MXAN_6640 family putative metalloprotease [Candidatus Zixiibacteriota bacterium]